MVFGIRTVGCISVPRFPRLVVPGLPHHVTQRGVRRQRTFFDASDYAEYLDVALELLDEWPVTFWAYCLMPNHVHAVVVPDERDSLSKYFAALHRRYARRTNLRHDWLGHLWQKRFFSVVMDEVHTITALRYVELNPVRAGICKRATDWRWSSVRANLGVAEDPLIDRSRTAQLVPDWGALLSGADDQTSIERLRHETGTGRPVGSEAFMGAIESQTGRRVRKRRAGRKKK